MASALISKNVKTGLKAGGLGVMATVFHSLLIVTVEKIMEVVRQQINRPSDTIAPLEAPKYTFFVAWFSTLWLANKLNLPIHNKTSLIAGGLINFMPFLSDKQNYYMGIVLVDQ